MNQYVEIPLKSDSLIALMTTIEENGPYTRTVYLSNGYLVERMINEEGEEEKEKRTRHEKLVIVENLEFTMYVAIPRALDPALFQLGMIRSYSQSQYSNYKMNQLREDIKRLKNEISQTDDPLTIERKKCLLHQYTEELNVVEMNRDSLSAFNYLMRETTEMTNYVKRLDYIKSRMKNKKFFFIKKMSFYEIPKSGKLSTKIKDFTLQKIKFDNHQILVFFLNKFRQPFSLWKDVLENEGEGGEEEDEGKEKWTRVESKYHIIILSDSSPDSLPYQHGTEENYIMKQTLHFPQQEHFFLWEFSLFTPVKKSPQFHAMFRQRNVRKMIHYSISLSMENVIQESDRMNERLKINTIYFSLLETIDILLVDDKCGKKNLLSVDVVKTPKIQSIEGRLRVSQEKTELLQGKKRTFYTLKNSGKKSMIQTNLYSFQSLSSSSSSNGKEEEEEEESHEKKKKKMDTIQQHDLSVSELQ